MTDKMTDPMTATLKAAVLTALKAIAAPDGRGSIVSAGLVSDIAVDDSRVMFALHADPARLAEFEPLRLAAERAASAVPGVSKALVALTEEKSAAAVPAKPAAQAAPRHVGIPGIRHMVAVASGKGGVGKSTTAINLALGLVAEGLSVGILDADVYGPSIPRLLGIYDKPRAAEGGGKRMMPLEAFGLKAMSIGFLVGEDTPMIWRGPMVMSALMQMLRDVVWGELDVLIIDMPPGTGDAQLTLAQQTPLSGAVIVSTPQDLALIDARKGLNMFRRVQVPVLGIIENMSYFTCSNCGSRHEIFGHGGARAEAEKLDVSFLGEVPLDADIRARSDRGEPIVALVPDGAIAQIYRTMAQTVWQKLNSGAGRKAPPRIILDPQG